MSVRPDVLVGLFGPDPDAPDADADDRTTYIHWDSAYVSDWPRYGFLTGKDGGSGTDPVDGGVSAYEVDRGTINDDLPVAYFTSVDSLDLPDDDDPSN